MLKLIAVTFVLAAGKFECNCLTNRSGYNSDIHDPMFGTDVLPPQEPSQKSLEEENQMCFIKVCEQKARNNICDEECNSYACNFDGGDCSLGINPWKNCKAGIKCWEVFLDNQCNVECNNSDCLYDGFDCDKLLRPCNAHYDTYCLKNFGNGYCDDGCNNEECNWDGLDCEPEPPVLASGSLVVVVLVKPEVFLNNSVPFLREIGHALRTNIRLKLDENNHPKVYPWRSTETVSSSTMGQFSSSGTEVYLDIDNRRCSKLLDGECFDTAKKAAQFLAAAHSRHVLSTPFSIILVQESDEEKGRGETNFIPYLHAGLILVCIAAIILGVLITAKRQRAKGKAWFSEGFLRNNSGQRRRSGKRRPDGKEIRNLHKQSSINQLEAMDNGTVLPEGRQWSDDDVNQPPLNNVKNNRSHTPSNGDTHTVMTTDDNDPRPWSQQHITARP